MSDRRRHMHRQDTGRPSVAAIERVSPDDLMSLAADRGTVPMQVGAVLTFATGQRIDPSGVARLLAERVPHVPRLRQRLARVPFGAGRPIWVDDPSFSI